MSLFSCGDYTLFRLIPRPRPSTCPHAFRAGVLTACVTVFSCNPPGSTSKIPCNSRSDHHEVQSETTTCLSLDKTRIKKDSKLSSLGPNFLLFQGAILCPCPQSLTVANVGNFQKCWLSPHPEPTIDSAAKSTRT